MRPSSLSSTTNFFATVAAASTAGASACAGGVCALGAQAASAWAASASSMATFASAASANATSYPWWHQQGHHLALPFFTKVALVFLWISTFYTVISLASRPKRYAWIAAVGAILITISELRWLPGGSAPMIFGIFMGMPALLLAPWLPAWSPRRCLSRAIRYALFILPVLAIGAAVFTQVAYHWQPCPLCFMERFGFFFVSLSVLLRKPTLALVFACLSGVPVMLQLIEMAGQSRVATFISGVCTSVGHSCASTGAKVFVFPMAYDAAGLACLLFVLAMLNAATAWNSIPHRVH